MNIKETTINVTEHTAFYENLALTFLILAIIFAIVAIVLCIVLKVPHSIRVLTGMGVGKEIRQISADTQQGNSYSKQSHNKAALTWNTSGLLKKKDDSDDTVLLDTGEENSDETQLLSENLMQNSDETQLLGANMMQGTDETQLLGVNMMQASDETQLLGVSGVSVPNSDETTVLGVEQFSTPPGKKADNPDFEIEEEIVITGNSTKGN